MTAEVHFGGEVFGAATQAERGSRLAGGLQRLGLEDGDVLAVLLRNSRQNVDVVHACREAGIFFCPLNWHSTADEVAVLQVPRTIELSTLPRDDNGKIAKRRLREKHWAGQARRV